MGHAGVILLSGGLDSVASVFWAQKRYRRLFALSMMYGQPNVDHELYAAGLAAKVAGIEDWRRLPLSDALRGASNLTTDRPIVPGRNDVFISVAAALAVAEWGGGRIDVIVGANADDAADFPDCRPEFIEAKTNALSLAHGRDVLVVGPWLHRTKRQILYAVKPEPIALAACQRSWSCYHAKGPCGSCSACLKRAAAFAANGVPDLTQEAQMCGGDPHRER